MWHTAQISVENNPSNTFLKRTNQRHHHQMSKTFGKGDGSKPVLKDINLSFYPGVKIGVLGGNGAGKSTLIKIMAGTDDDFMGEARPARWAKVSKQSKRMHCKAFSSSV